MACTKLRPYALLTYVLVVLFGSSSWMSVNGTWIELPLMVNILPEKWSLPSYLAIIIQIAFIGPLIYAIGKKLFPYAAKRSAFLASLASSSFGENFTPAPLIYASLVVLVLCHLLLAVFWNRTTVWPNDVQHSTALFVLFFFISMMNSLSNILYLPYMIRFRPTYVTAYFIGMGVSALVPSVLGLIQGAGRVDCASSNSTNGTFPKLVTPLFGVGEFNAILCAWLALVVVGFYFLNRLPRSQDQSDQVDKAQEDAEGENFTDNETGTLKNDTPAGGRPENLETTQLSGERRRQLDSLSPTLYVYLLIITLWVCALMNGILPSIQSFATLPYGQLTYHLAVTISNLANPVACFIPFFVHLRRVGLVVTVWTAIATILSVFILTAAAWSPRALLGSGGGSAGPTVSIVSWTLVTGVLAYLRTVIAGVLRESGGGAKSENRLFWCGLFTQIGAFIGAVVMFPLINVKEIFKTAPVCGS